MERVTSKLTAKREHRMPDYLSERTAIVRQVKSFLLGPLDPDEILESSPVDTYLTGILWPQGESLIGSFEDDNQEGAPTSEDRETDLGVPGYRTIRPCSIGMTFAAYRDASLTVSLATTARYLPVELQSSDNLGTKRNWSRVQLNYKYTISKDEGTWTTHNFINQDGDPKHDPEICLHIKRRVDGNLQVVTITLINKSKKIENKNRDQLCLFQAALEVNAFGVDGKGAIRARPQSLIATNDEEAQSVALLYRDVLEFAVGHGIAVEWDQPSEGLVTRISTSWMPEANVKNMSDSGHSILEKFLQKNPDVLNAKWLARFDERNQIINALNDFIDTYGCWIHDHLESSVNSLPQELQDPAMNNLKHCKEVLRRMEEGIVTLRVNEIAWNAFTLTNAAMNQQAKYRNNPELKWRPFQLAYILLVLPGMVNLDSNDRNCLDLLWFPTGGGKTEAYLALAAFQIFFRRLDDAERQKKGGVDVLMRYTLRLLTVQQFQRAASLICACDLIRCKNPELGSAPISLGLYVGGDTTPNRVEHAEEALRQERNGEQPRSTPRQLLNCPVCGNELLASSYNMGESGIEIRCDNYRCESGGEPLPVYTVDDYIYLSPPSLLIGTIDKFAQLPRRKDLSSLFGLGTKLRPGLIIQDELHLISGPLGSIAGLYETVVDLMCTTNEIRPKIIGSTATIGQAGNQVRALFDRDVLQFPPPGFTASDSFFAVRDEEGPDRLFIGLSTAGRSPKFSLQAATAALLQAAKHQEDNGLSTEALDPFWTTVIYFNSLRELGGAHVLIQDDVKRSIDFFARLNSDNPRELEGETIELSSRVVSRDLPEYLKQLEASLVQDEENIFYSDDPPDVVLASNMISVGVDVPRLGQMLINGQPKSTAEYIQASSRIGRGLHGMVLTLYNFSRPRDVSHFEHFHMYHASLYKNVEATSVTPWAPRARDKALHAVFVAAVRHLVSGMQNDGAAINFNRSNSDIDQIMHAIMSRAHNASLGAIVDEIEPDLIEIIKRWEIRSQTQRNSGAALLYWKKAAPYGNTKPHLMYSAEDGRKTVGGGWPTPNSMREVEPSTAFVLHSADRY